MGGRAGVGGARGAVPRERVAGARPGGDRRPRGAIGRLIFGRSPPIATGTCTSTRSALSASRSASSASGCCTRSATCCASTGLGIPDAPPPTTGIRSRWRRARREQQRWNVAGDAEINDDLHTTNLAAPGRRDPPCVSSACPRAGPPSSTGTRSIADVEDARMPDDEAEAALEHDCGSGCDGQPRASWDCNKPGLSHVAARLRRARHGAADPRAHSGAWGHARRAGSAGPTRFSSRASTGAGSSPRTCVAGPRMSTGRVDFTYRRPSRRASAVPGRRAAEPATASAAGRVGDRHLRAA